MFSHVLEVRSFLSGGLHTLKIVILKVFLAGEKESKVWAYHRNAPMWKSHRLAPPPHPLKQ